MDRAAGSANYQIEFSTSSPKTLPHPDSTDRRFVVIDPFSRPSAAAKADQIRAHADWLAARQRASGVRIRLCSTGCYSIYDDQGHFIARTPPPDNLTGLPGAQLRTSAARLAYAEELFAVCRVADLDYEQSGTVAPSTIVAIRQLLSDIGAA